MREAPADTAQAIGLALLLHVLLFALVFVGMHWTRSAAPQSAGLPISAELVDADALSPAAQQALAEEPEPLPPPPPEPEPVERETIPPPQPLPEPVPEDAPVEPQLELQEQIPDPDVIDQDEARADSESELAAEREQEERRRQEQIELAERQKQEEAEQKRRLARQQREEELEKLRAEQAQLQREAEEAERKLEQIADARRERESEQAAASTASPPRGTPDGGGYSSAVAEAILRQWVRPDTIALGQVCRIQITQLPGGEVINVEFGSPCPYDALGRRSVEAAILRASPLPYRGFENEFQRRLILNFEAQDR